MERDEYGNRRLRVLFLVDRMGYPDGTTHGGTTYFVNTLPALQRTGIDLTVCFMGTRHPAAEKLESAGIEPVFLGRRKWNPLVFLDVLRLVKSRDIDVLHLASLKSLLFGRWAARLLNRAAIAHLHDMTPLPPGLGPLQRHAAKWTHATLILTNAMRCFAQQTFGIPGEKAQVLPYGFDARPFRNPCRGARAKLRRIWGVKDDQPLIIVPGRVEREKGQEQLVRALPALRRLVPNAAVRLVGTGSALERVKQLVQRLGLCDCVGFTGYRSDMPNVLAAGDVVAVPSMGNEAFGFVALEAMAAGKPVVAFRDGGLPEVISDGESGIIVPRGDTKALADALASVLNDSRLAARLGRGGLARAEMFAMEHHIKQLLSVYNAVAARRAIASRPQHETCPSRAVRPCARRAISARSA